MENKNRSYEISGTQQGIYIECMNQPESTVYNLPFLYRLPANLDAERFVESFEQVAAHAQGLNTRLREGADGQILQYIAEEPLRVERHSVTEAEFAEIKAGLVRPFALMDNPLMRAALYTTEENQWFFMDIHHMIYDGFSNFVLPRQLRRCYEGVPLTEYHTDGIDVAEYEASLVGTEIYEAAGRYFENLLDDVESDVAPLVDVEGQKPSQSQMALPYSLTQEAVDAFCQRMGVSKTVFFTAAMGLLVAKFACRERIALATVYNGRNRQEYQNAITMLVKTLPYVVDVNKTPSVAGLLAESKGQLSQSRKYSFYPFTEIVSRTGASSEVLFAYQGKVLDYTLMEGYPMEVERFYDDAAISQTKISAELAENGQGTFTLHINYRSDCYSQAFMETLARSYGVLLQEMMEKELLSELSILSAEDRALIDTFNRTERDVDLNRTVVAMFEEQVQAHPDTTAVVYLDRSYTYGQVEEISRRVASYLVQAGLTAEDTVAILLPRSEYIAILPMAVSRAGCAYQPLDPSYPPERLNFMVGDSGAKLLIADRGLRPILSEYEGPVLYTDEIETLQDTRAELPVAKAEDLFTLLYTSGSTGVPKGCMLEYGNITAFCNWFGRFYHMDAASKYAAYASFGFDASMMDTYGTLSNGGELHILDEGIRLDFTAIGDYFEAHGITHTFMTTQIGRQFAMNMRPSGLKALGTGGEKLVPCEPPKGYDFYNFYGPTECTILTTSFLVDRYYGNVPIGKSLDNIKQYVTDQWGHLLPPGACGELMITGYQVSRGYLNRPEKTAEAYSENPFDDKPGYERMYHSGDVVRYMMDGNVQIIGRQDGQVKVRGFRIELTEIEEVIRRYPGIRDATVAAFDDPAGGKYVAAYVVSDETIDIESLHGFIAEEKPPYMVPAVTMQIEAIPVNQNQKVNKRALPIPERKVEELIPPQTPMQQQIYDILAEVLGHREFGVTTNIYMAGITSITSVRLNILLSKAFERPIKTSDLKEYDTIEKLEVLLSQAGETETFEILERYPLTKTQEGIFVECIAHPGSTIYNIPLLLRISEKLEEGRLLEAIAASVNAHGYIMSTIEMDEAGEICLKRVPDRIFTVQEILREAYETKADLLANLTQPYELMNSRLFRIGLHQVAGDGTYLYLDFHHIISDGTSMLILLEDISRAYAGEVLENETYSGYEASLIEQRARAGEAYDKAKAYYDSIFAGCDGDCLPPGNCKGDSPASAVMNYYTTELTAGQVKDYCSTHRVTANGFFTGAFGLTLGKFVNKEQAVFVTIYNGRSDTRLARSMSMYVKTYPVLCDVGPAAGGVACSEYLRSVGTQLENSMTNDIYSFAEISRSYQLGADVMFAYQGEDFGFTELCGEPCHMEDIQLDQVKAPLNVNVFLEGDRIRFFCEYRSDRFDAVYIETFLEAMEMAAKNLMAASSIRQVSVLSNKERKLLQELNATEGTSYTEIKSLPQRLDEEIAKHPDKIAVTAAGVSITYQELGTRSNSVGNGLVELGVVADQPVALMLHRTVDVYPVRQGILKSGGAFLSIEPDYPADRITYILENAGAKILITTADVYEERREVLDNCNARIVFVEELYQYDGSARPEVTIAPEQLAYCIFTSGSTGKPKGVMIEHRNLLNFLDNHENNCITHYYLDDTSVMLGLAAITFDVSVLEEFLPLYHGKSVTLATQEEIHNPILLAQTMLATGVDVMKCTPSYIQTILDVPIVQEAFRQLKAICIGAEPFPVGLYPRMRAAGIHGRIYNSYGPSETTISVTIDDMVDERIAIGKPIGNTKVWMLDAFDNILPRFAPGELTIAGDSVGRGYMGLPEMTAEKYITLEGLPAYRSGDIGIWNGDGKIECKGRKDNQVKLRGLRVELDEIEKVMMLHEGIQRSVVLVKENESGQYLCGYYTGEGEVDTEKLAAMMKTKLTEYMVPGVFVYLERFPMNQNGKVDKKALPEPVVKAEVRSGRAPATELEQVFCEMFAQALGLGQVFAEDDFFALGGTSLSASKIAMSCMMKQLPVVYANVFEYTTPAALAAFVAQSRGETEPKATTIVEPARAGESLDAPEIQQVLAYNVSAHAPEVTHEPIRRVLLSGSTGFLGIHVLKELLNQNCETVYCLVRKGSMDSAEQRLKTILMYYFEDICQEAFDTGRIQVVEADITDENLAEALADMTFDTIINCAAIVKHFAVGDMIERVNVEGVKHLIDMALAKDAKLVQISTVSVAGESINNSVPADKVITEKELYIGQSMENRYVNTKYRAEEAVLTAISKGLRGKIIRVGNLMSREQDGEFQINYLTNGFMSRLRAYAALERFPVGSSDALVEFSPIDYVAKAAVLLAGTNDEFTVFHAYNCHHVHMANVIASMNEMGIPIAVVKDEDYVAHFQKLLQDESMNMKISSLISYDNKEGGEHRFVGSDNKFTIKVLYRLGFAWPLISESYMGRAIEALSTLDFFEEEE